jgi:hypothetical protein
MHPDACCRAGRVALRGRYPTDGGRCASARSILSVERSSIDERPQVTNHREGRVIDRWGPFPGVHPPGAGTCDRARSAGRSPTEVTVSSRTVGRRGDPVGHERRYFACTAGVGTFRGGALPPSFHVERPQLPSPSTTTWRRDSNGRSRGPPEPYAYRPCSAGASVHAVRRDHVRHEVRHRRRRNAPSFSSTAPFPDAVTRCRPHADPAEMSGSGACRHAPSLERWRACCPIPDPSRTAPAASCDAIRRSAPRRRGAVPDRS